jgi:hypothetical protein
MGQRTLAFTKQMLRVFNFVELEDPDHLVTNAWPSTPRSSETNRDLIATRRRTSTNKHIYIYIYCIYLLHLGAFNIENAPRPNLRARSTWSEPTAPPRPNRCFVFVPPACSRQNLFTSDSSLQLEDTPSCNQQATNVATGATTKTQVCN